MNKPRFVPIPAPSDLDRDRGDLSIPYPIQIGDTFYVDNEELERANERHIRE